MFSRLRDTTARYLGTVDSIVPNFFCHFANKPVADQDFQKGQSTYYFGYFFLENCMKLKKN